METSAPPNQPARDRSRRRRQRALPLRCMQTAHRAFAGLRLCHDRSSAASTPALELTGPGHTRVLHLAEASARKHEAIAPVVFLGGSVA